MASISLCMIVKNEEAVLERCLDSLRGIPDEIIIVDTGSTDRTKEIAAKYTNHIYDFTWVNDFSAARNFAFSKASCEYIYSADADEVLEEADRRKFLQLKEALLPEIEIVEMIYVNPPECNSVYNFEREPRPKLFRRLRQFRFIDPVHETVATEPLVFSSDIEIMHRPQSLHSSRDFQIFEGELEKGNGLSKRLYSMYAKELFISGTEKDLAAAEPWFEKRHSEEGISAEERLEAACVLAKCYFDSGRFENLLALALTDAMDAALPAELCYLLGGYYEERQSYTAAKWYQRAALQAENYVCLAYGGENALEKANTLFEKLGRNEEIVKFA